MTNHGVVIGQGTSALTTTIAGLSGQVLMSGGGGVDPNWSGAKFPTLIGAAGTILRSDGTDWVATTATYPTTTTISQILYSSSANVIGGLATANNGLLVTGNTGIPSILAGPGTSGNILQSNAAAAPSYSTPTYPSTSGTSRKILVSDGTNNVYSTETWAVPGTSGNVLTSDGTNWTSAAPPSPSSSVYATLDFYDDFLYATAATTSGSGNWGGLWFSNSNASLNFNGTAAISGHPGIATLDTGGASTNVSCLYACTGTANNSPIKLGAGAVTITWYFNINTLSTSSQRYTFWAGLGDTNSTSSQANGCYVLYSDNLNSGKWQYVTAAASSRTTSNSNTTVATGWQVIQVVVNAGATSVSFSAGTTFSGLTSLGTANTLNIPTNSVGLIIGMLKSVGNTSRTIDVDLVTLNIPLTTAR